MVVFMDTLRVMHGDDPLALEVCVRHVASAIEDQRRGEGKADPRDIPPPGRLPAVTRPQALRSGSATACGRHSGQRRLPALAVN